MQHKTASSAVVTWLFLIAAGLGPLVGQAMAAKAAASPEKAVGDLLQRLLPGRSAGFVLESIPKDNGRDVFELQSKVGKVVVRGSSGVAMASGLNWYLKYFGHCHVSFCGDQLKLADPLPPVPQKIRRISPLRYSYCFNYCAFSYTMAFWDWPQWERMIDWMALHGVNMPLAVTGQEAIWYKVYRDLGLKDEQIRSFFVGPAFLPFGWMGCIDGWGGPLPTSWIQSHLELQKKIVARERELGMTPVLQGFTGHVPPAIRDVFPGARLQRLPKWCEFPGTHFLDPTDPLFERIGRAFIEEQTRQFGTDHLYASDTFIEMSPPSKEPKFLAEMGRAVFRSMTVADPAAIWVMQGWIFINNASFWQPPQNKALLGAVPDDRLILLDLHCESSPAWTRTESFYGKPWVWCIIQSFGAQVSLHAGLPQISKNLQAAISSPQRGRLSGVGLIMEGFGYNPVVFDLVTEMAWRDEVPKADSWRHDFLLGRYGRCSAAAEDAWATLYRTAYTMPGQLPSIVCARPALGMNPSTPGELMAPAWRRLLDAAPELRDVEPYRYDVVHVARQTLGSLGGRFYRDVCTAYQAKDRQATAEAGQRLLELLRDMDELLGTRPELLLGKWLEDSKRWATNDRERRLYEWNARTLITLWGPRDSMLHEYSQRQWSGMLQGFYLPRWELFLSALDRSLEQGKPLDAAQLESRLRDWEVQWTHDTRPYPAMTHGDCLAVSEKLWNKYHDLIGTQKIDSPSLTTGKPASCSAELSSYPAALANDGRASSTDAYWATDVKSDKAAWWQVDLEKPTTVGRTVIVLYYGDRRVYGFTVEGSLDGQRWDMLADRNDNKAPSTWQGISCSFTPRAVRYLRVAVTRSSANTGRHLVEVMAFAK